MVMDAYNSVKFLNVLPLSLLEESLTIFRHNLFAAPEQGRKSSPLQIALAIDRELKEAGASSALQQLYQSYDGNLARLSQDVTYAMQIVLEFMDKGMKGMLSGDLSTFAIK